MTRPIRFLCLALALASPPALAADLPVFAPPPVYGAPGYGPPAYGPPAYGPPGSAGPAYGGGGFRVARVPVRPPPLRYDIYGYPLLPGAPNPLAVGGGCPAALQPDYDADGNFAGYAPIPMCR